MHYLLTNSEMAECDRYTIEELGVAALELMENAGAEVADLCAELSHSGCSVVVVCGKGNNGGDGFVLARQLMLRGYTARVAYCGERAKAKRETDAGINLSVLENMAGSSITDVASGEDLTRVLNDWSDAVLLVDCLYGTGLAQPLRPDGVALVNALDAAVRPKIACDLPSGLDCDSGKPLGAVVRAVRTATFVARKKGFDEPGSEEFTGTVTVVPIGCPQECWAHVAA